MPTRELRSRVGAASSINPATYNTNQTSATGIDTQGYEALSVIFVSGALTDGTHTPSLNESDDNATWTAVAAADMVGTLVALSANSVQRVAYIGSKRYIQPAVASSGATGCIYGAVACVGYPRQGPIA